MSVIAVKKTKGGFVMASDSISVYGDQVKNNTQKMYDLGHIVFGFCGTAAECGLMKAFATTHKAEGSDLVSVYRFLYEFAEWKGKISDTKEVAGEYIFGFPSGEVYMAHGFFVDVVIDNAAIGYGYIEALTALALGHDAERSVEIACQISPYCALPVMKIEKQQ